MKKFITKTHYLTSLLLAICINTLIAQPSFKWVKQMGGNLNDACSAVAVDKLGNIYTTGFFYEKADFDPSAGTYNLTAKGRSDVFISKLSANGSFVWAKSFSGPNTEAGYAIALDGFGNIYTAGYFSDTVDFDPGPGIFNLIAKGAEDAFIAKLDANGNLVWAKNFGGMNSTLVETNKIALDKKGNVYAIGSFNGIADFDPSNGVYNLTAVGGFDIFIAKLNSNGDFIWAKSMGGPKNDEGYSTAVDTLGNVYSTGYFQGRVDFDPGTGSYNLDAAGYHDIFISKLDANGNFVWAKRIGGVSVDEAYSIALDATGNSYTSGRFIETVDFDPGPGTYNLTSQRGAAFVLKLDTNGNFIWAKNTAGTSNSGAEADVITLDHLGNVYTIGSFNDTVDFDPSVGIDTHISFGSGAFIWKLDTNGNFKWAVNTGEENYQGSYAIAIDDSTNIINTGAFSDSVDFDPGPRIYKLTAWGAAGLGFSDIYVTKLSQSTNSITALSPTSLNYQIFPNPTTGLITVESSQAAQVQVYNVTGELVYQNASLQNRSQHDLSALANGVYFLKLFNEKVAVTEKLVIAR